jgi:hypothetical protein
MQILTSRVVGNSRVLLLDLVWTLAVREGGNHRVQRGDYAEVIRTKEHYRLSLLRQIQAERFFVILLTARSHRYEAVTLENIARHAGGWQPDVSIFNEHEVEPPIAKSRALHHYIFPEFGPQRSRYFALESNIATRRMYSCEGIEAMTWEAYLSEGNQLTMNV